MNRSFLPQGAASLGARFGRGARLIMGLYTLTFVLGLIEPIASFIQDFLLLRPALAIGPRPWQVLTAPFILFSPEPRSALIQLLFLGLLLYSVGHAVEGRLGTPRYLRNLALSSVIASVGAALCGRLLPGYAGSIVYLGSEPVFIATMTAFAALYGDMQVLPFGIGRPVSGRTLTLVILGLILFMQAVTLRFPDLTASILAALGGFHIGTGKRFAPILRARALLKDIQLRRARSKVQVLDGGKARPGRRGPQNAGRGPGPGPGGRWMN